jgi:hypothetical protein
MVPGAAAHAARQDVALDLAGGVLFQQVAPFLLRHALPELTNLVVG